MIGYLPLASRSRRAPKLYTDQPHPNNRHSTTKG